MKTRVCKLEKKTNYFQVIRNEGYKVSQKIGWEFEAKS